METIQSINWLKQNNLYEVSKKYSASLKRIFIPCLAVKDEKLLIIGDKGQENKNISAILAGAYYLAAQEFSLDAKLVLQDKKSRTEPTENHIIDSLKNLEENNIIFLNMSDKLGSIGELGKSFRKWAKKRKHRFISASSLGDLKNNEINRIIQAIDINYKPMQIEHENIKNKLDNTEEIHITTKSGTDLYYNKKGIESISADGNYTLSGAGGNLPAGEVYSAPNSRNVEGKVVIDASSRNYKSTTLIKQPIILTIEQGSITQIEGKEEAELLRKSFRWAEENSKYPGSIRRVSEFGIGLNPHAQLSGAMIIDDKVKGTAHIGIGSNYWFGGSVYAILHLDQVFKEPRIFLDNKELKL